MVRKAEECIKMVILAALWCGAAGCSMGMDDTLSRTRSDPYMEIPAVRSFNGDRSIMISWNYDEAADEYYLWKAVNDHYPLRYTLVYSGPSVQHRETFDLSNVDQMYLYRLGKRRGSRTFVDLSTPGRAGLGIVSGKGRDQYEPNDTPAQARYLDTRNLYANSWYYHSNTTDGLGVYDEDWYYVDIPAHCRVGILLYDFDAIDGEAVDHFELYILPNRSAKLVSNAETFIENYEHHEVRAYFCVTPIYVNFQRYHDLEEQSPHPQPAGTFGAFISYTIRMNSLEPIN